MPEQSKILSVEDLNEYVKMLIDGNPVLSNVWVKGEISNLTRHNSGHCYFSLKNENSRVSAVMFKANALKLTFRPENGMKVILHGRLSVYTRDGQYQLYATELTPDGIGALTIAYEQLKKRLQEEGIFSEKYKKPLPKIPRRVGVITSPTGAAVRDIINVSARRFPFAQIVLFPALVQGEGAENDLINGIEYFDKNKNVDVIIIGRGGGSIEDLWAFNSEKLCRAIFKCSIPVISAVGHETDFTICDFVSDKRAPTPSAAAELAVPDKDELKNKFNNVTIRMSALLNTKIKTNAENLRLLSASRVIKNPMAYIDDRRFDLVKISEQMEKSILQRIDRSKQGLIRLSAVLEAVSPLKLLSKGYTSVYGDNGEIIKDAKELKAGDNVNFVLRDGTVNAEVKKTILNSDRG